MAISRSSSRSLRRKPIIAMVHVGALPGTPRSARPIADLAATAAGEARLYARAGVDAILIENMHDAPYMNGRVGPEIVAAMTAVGAAVRASVALPLGVQILAAANAEALAVALAIGAQFVRVENFTYAHVADEGLMPVAAAGPLLRYRRAIGAAGVRIFADIKKKHASHALTADIDLSEAAVTAKFCGADGVIVTGAATGRAADPDDLRALHPGAALPVWVGSGVTAANLDQYWALADGFIVGSEFKRGGSWANAVDEARVRRFMAVVNRLRADDGARLRPRSRDRGSA